MQKALVVIRHAVLYVDQVRMEGCQMHTVGQLDYSRRQNDTHASLTVLSPQPQLTLIQCKEQCNITHHR
jgi:hypothetical protein